MQGVVTNFDNARRFGWIKPFAGREHVLRHIFFHEKDVRPGEPLPAPNDLVTFEIGTDKKGRSCAVDVRRDAAAEAEQHFHHADATKDGGPIRYGSNLLTAG
jgi:cold shock CspA family protein